MTLPKDPEKLETARERARVYAREYHQRMKDDPEYKAKMAARAKKWRKESPRYEEYRAIQLEKTKAWLASHPGYSRVYMKDRYDRGLEYIRQVKGGLGCIRCGESDPIVLEFHHRDPGAKEYNLGQMALRSRAKIDAEIAKCDVVCANCHRRLHYELRIANRDDA